MSDLVDGNQSRLKVAHKYLVENDRFYRAGLAAAPISLTIAVAAIVALLEWSPPAPLPLPAVPTAPPTSSGHAQSGTPAPPSSSQSQPPAPAEPPVDFTALRDRATTDTAAFNNLRARAEAGNASAQFYIANLYDPTLRDIKFEKNAATAAGWYRKAADQGEAASQFNVGLYYGLGIGVAKDDVEAARWYRKAADQGYHPAENNLGSAYTRGAGVPRDLDQAMGLFRRAVQGGYLLALANLALCYDRAWGVPRNPLAAYIWYSIAASRPDADSRGKAAIERDLLAKDISPAQLADAQRAAENWKPGVRGRLGVAVADLTPDEAKAIETLQKNGEVIRGIEEGSPAAHAELQPGDLITAIDDQPVSDRAALEDLIGSSVPGQVVELLVEKASRRGWLQRIRVQIGVAAASQ
jgi:uncharacterized protein